jgi:hypothetical protein
MNSSIDALAKYVLSQFNHTFVYNDHFGDSKHSDLISG